MEKLQSVKISLICASGTNIRKGGFDGLEVRDLAASIKEKGVLVPIIVRSTIKRENNHSAIYEVVAGNRRFKAAKAAGLKEIPVIVRKLTDEEAKEVQIIENLQRLDVHPLDEGLAYRKLMEESTIKYTIGSIAIKVGKSSSYIRQRLFLTNLIERAAKSYCKGKITDSHAVLIAKLSPNDQNKTMRYLADEWSLPIVRELKKWIEEEFYQSLDFQPWLKNKEANLAVGECVECEPNRNSLFGKVKEGVCTDLKCWKRKMEKYVKWQIATAKKKGVELLKVSKEYSYLSTKKKAEEAGIIMRNHYESLGFKKKDRCKFARKAIVAEGKDIGTFLWVCASPECPKHHTQHTTYKLTPKEKEKRTAEVKKEKEKRIKAEEKIVETLNKIKWPLDKKTLDAIFEMTLMGQGTTVLRPVAKRFEIKAKKVMSYGSASYDWEDPIREAAKKMKNAEKLRFIIGVMLERMWGDPKRKILKSLSK